MNYWEVITELIFVFWCYGLVAIAYHQARKSTEGSFQKGINEVNELLRRGGPSALYWYWAPIRAYAMGLLRAFAVVMVFLVLTFPFVRSGLQSNERALAVVLAFIISALNGIASGRSDSRRG